jgi:hypothetical protein
MTRQRYIGPTPERLAKAGRAVEPVESETGYTTLRMLDGSPLEQLATIGKRSPRKGITGDQYHAGCRYYADAYLSGMFASGVVDLVAERVDGGQHKDVSSQKLEAMSRYNAALKALDRVSVEILADVVLHEIPLNRYAERFTRFPVARERRAIALQRLRDALDQLDEHYYRPRRDGIRSGHLSTEDLLTD